VGDQASIGLSKVVGWTTAELGFVAMVQAGPLQVMLICFTSSIVEACCHLRYIWLIKSGWRCAAATPRCPAAVEAILGNQVKGATMIARILFFILLCAGISAFAHPDGAETQVNTYDCQHPPETAVTELPGLLGEAGKLMCFQSGQRIVASKTWSWRYSGSFFNSPNVPAHAHAAARGMMPPFYFKKVWVEELSREEADQRSEQLSRQIDIYRPAKRIAGMTIVKAENNYGQVTEIFMPMQSETEGWAIVCAPECQSDYVIVISKLEPN
jgi:hypothetical protein